MWQNLEKTSHYGAEGGLHGLELRLNTRVHTCVVVKTVELLVGGGNKMLKVGANISVSRVNLHRAMPVENV